MSDYVAVHWRRGDQITDVHRCNGLENGGPDTSVNCKSVKQFMYEVKLIKRRLQLPKKILTYVATNEKQRSIINMLEESKYATYRAFGSKAAKLDLFERFVVELQVMCNAKVSLLEVAIYESFFHTLY